MNIALAFKRLALAWGPERGPERLRRVLLSAIAAGLAVWAVLGLWGPDSAELDALEADVAQWQARLSVSPAPLAVVDVAASNGSTLLDWPTPAQAATVWPWLQQRLQAHGLRVLALRPENVGATGPGTPGLPEQTVSLHLQGRWQDWLALSLALATHAPWWVVEQWQVVPAGVGAVELRIELQARVAWLPPNLREQGQTAWNGPQWSAVDVSDGVLGSAPLFGPAGTSVAEGGASAFVLPQDPRQWPVHALRLQGVWQASGQWHALLGAGLQQTSVRVGQWVGQEGLRVRRVDMAGVELTAGPGEPVVRLDWQGDKQ